MRDLTKGFLAGIFCVTLIWVIVAVVTNRRTGPTIQPFTHAPSTTNIAGSTNNYSARVAANQRFSLTVALADSGSGEVRATTTDLMSAETTIAKLEARLVQPNTTSVPLDDQWELLSLTQPTVELFSLRGSGAVAELGVTELVAGRYDALRLTFASVKGRRSNGQLIETIIDPSDRILELNQTYDWRNPNQDIQLVIDLDTPDSVREIQGTIQFKPSVRSIHQNDRELEL